MKLMRGWAWAEKGKEKKRREIRPKVSVRRERRRMESLVGGSACTFAHQARSVRAAIAI
jgi:hypothetical protein